MFFLQRKVSRSDTIPYLAEGKSAFVQYGELETRGYIVLTGESECSIAIPFVTLEKYIKYMQNFKQMDFLHHAERMIYYSEQDSNNWELFNLHFLALKLSAYRYLKNNTTLITSSTISLAELYKGAEFGNQVENIRLSIPNELIPVITLIDQFTGNRAVQYKHTDETSGYIADQVVYNNGSGATYTDGFFFGKGTNNESVLLAEQHKQHAYTSDIIYRKDDVDKEQNKLQSSPCKTFVFITTAEVHMDTPNHTAIIVYKHVIDAFYGPFAHRTI
jgi:hypothetical protein